MPTPLSRERILSSAVRLADRDGLDAASLRKVAADLGVHVTSLYHHVPTKEALLDGLAEELFAGADLPRGELSWEEWVRRFVAAVAALARTHPGAFAVLLRRPAQGPTAAATFESGLAAFTRAGLSVPAAYAAVKTVSLAVIGCSVEQAGLAAGEDAATDVTALPGEGFPLLRRLVALADEVEGVDVVGTLADVLVAGLAVRLP